MKILSAFALGTLLVGVSLAPDAGAAQFGRTRDRANNNADRVCVYQDVRFVGWEQCFNPGDELADLGNHENAISSIRVFGRARVDVYEKNNFGGNSTEFTSDVADLNQRSLSGSKSWSDHIRSLRVTSDGGSIFGGGGSNTSSNRFPNQLPNQQSNNNESICVYDRPNYQGREQCWTATGASDLSRLGNWSDRISSVRVSGGARAEAYKDDNFGGQSILLDRNTPNLGAWSRQISSIQFDSYGRANGARGRGWARGRQR